MCNLGVFALVLAVVAAAHPTSPDPPRLIDYGRYCGLFHGRDDGGIPIDILDRYCQVHDLCVEALGYFSCRCNLQLLESLEHYTPTNEEAASEKASAVLALTVATRLCFGYSPPYNSYAIATSYGYDYLPIYRRFEEKRAIRVTAWSRGVYGYFTSRTEDLTEEVYRRLPSAKLFPYGETLDVVLEDETLVLVNVGNTSVSVSIGETPMPIFERYGHYCGATRLDRGEPLDALDRYCQLYILCTAVRGPADCYCHEQLLYYVANILPGKERYQEAWKWKEHAVGELLPIFGGCPLWSPYRDMYTLGVREETRSLAFFRSTEERLARVFHDNYTRLGYHFADGPAAGLASSEGSPAGLASGELDEDATIPLSGTLVIVNLGESDAVFRLEMKDCSREENAETSTTSLDPSSSSSSSSASSSTAAYLIAATVIGACLLVVAIVLVGLSVRRKCRRVARATVADDVPMLSDQ